MAAEKKRSGDDCDCGEGRFRAYSSRNVGEFQLRYLECVKCGAKCRSVVKAHEIVRRTKSET